MMQLAQTDFAAGNDRATLIIPGVEDAGLHSDALNNTWDWSQKDVTIFTVPGGRTFRTTRCSCAGQPVRALVAIKPL